MGKQERRTITGRKNSMKVRMEMKGKGRIIGFRENIMASETGEIGSVKVKSFECHLKTLWLCIHLQGMRSHNTSRGEMYLASFSISSLSLDTVTELYKLASFCRNRNGNLENISNVPHVIILVTEQSSQLKYFSYIIATRCGK